MNERQLFDKRRDAQARHRAMLAASEAEIAELDKQIAMGFIGVPDLGSARVGMFPVEWGGNTRHLTTNLAEVVVRDVAVAHLVRMDDRSAWLGLSLGDKGRVGVQLVAKAKPIRLEVTPTEYADVRYT